ncbi:MAG: CheR family methyltransferase, partial [Steroidobacterales bacterium]
YGRNSFRGTDLRFRERYFAATAQGQRLHDSVRPQVHFRHGNLTVTDTLPEAETYDAVFCRNLLIYFDGAAQNRAIGALRLLLAPEGLLFVGPAEAALLLSHDFTSAKEPLAFAFRKTLTVPLASAPAPAQSTRLSPARPTPTRPAPAHPGVPASLAAQSAPPLELSPPDRELKEASGLADQGRLPEAERSCEAHLRQHGPSVQAFHLMGLIRAARGNLAQAQLYYRKALYLDQDHHDTLLHLGLLLEKQGDARGAQVMRNRLRRLNRSSVN